MNEHTLQKLARPLLLLATLIWGSSFVVMKNTLDNVPVYFLLGFRFTIAAAILALVFWKKWRLMDKTYLISGAVMGTLLFLAYTTQTFGLAGTTPGKNAFLTAVYCVIVPFLYWFACKQRPDKFNVIAAVLCIAGIGFVSLNADFSVTWGDGLTLVSGIFYACHIVAVSKLSQGRDIFLLTTVQFATTALLAWICMGVTGGVPAGGVPVEAVGSLLYLAVAATAVALLFQNIGQKYTPPATAAVLLSLEAPFGVLFSVLFSTERPTPQMFLGFALIFVAVLCSETKFEFLRGRGNGPAAGPKKITEEKC